MKTRNSEQMLHRLKDSLAKMDDKTFFEHLGTSIKELKEKKKETNNHAIVAQLVEQRTCNARIGGSIPSGSTNNTRQFLRFFLCFLLCF